MFTAIKINDTNYKFKTWSLETEINWLNKINIFVWQNNSGKSRFMRNIFLNKIVFKDELSFKLDRRNLFISKIEDLLSEFSRHWLWDFNLIQYNIINKKIDYLTSYNIINECKINYQSIITNVDWLITWWINYPHKIDFKTRFDSEIKNIINDTDFIINIEDFSKIVYIPMLRWLKNPIKNWSDDNYKNRIISDYFHQTDNRDFDIFTWLSLYEDIKKMLLWTHDKRENIREFEKFLSENFFPGKQITLTPNIESDVLDVKIWDNPDLPIYDLWDWIQSIIINTFPLFKYKDEKLLLFIEEPEIGIHPWMQRILLNTFAEWIQNKGKEHQIYFTTHSNHFLDIALDKEINNKISIYQFKETGNNKEKHITNISKNKEVLDLLWVRNSSVFLSNCVIWVEWVSDRIYIKKFLELYQNQDWIKKFEEDKHYSIIEYWWGNITHFNFWEEENEEKITIEALTSNNFLIWDNDGENASEAKKERIKKFKKEKKDLCWFDIPEIENLLKFETYKKYFDDLNANWNRKWKKKTSYNEIVFNAEINKKDIWEIMRNVFIEYKTSSWKWYKNFQKTNDIKIICNDKKTFAERITDKYLINYSDLSNKAKKLTEKLYKFIEENNI